MTGLDTVYLRANRISVVCMVLCNHCKKAVEMIVTEDRSNVEPQYSNRAASQAKIASHGSSCLGFAFVCIGSKL